MIKDTGLSSSGQDVGNDQVRAAILGLDHNQKYCGAAIPQLPSLLFTYPRDEISGLIGQPNEAGNWRIGGVGPYALGVPKENGLSLNGAWRLTALGLVSAACNYSHEQICQALVNNATLSVDFSTSFIYRFAATHRKSARELREMCPFSAGQFPPIDLHKKNNSIQKVEIFSRVHDPVSSGAWGPNQRLVTKFDLTAFGVAYAYALRVRLAKLAGAQIDQGLIAFFLWWKELEERQSRLALHILLSEGWRKSYNGLPSYIYLQKMLPAILGVADQGPNAARARNNAWQTLVDLAKSVEGLSCTGIQSRFLAVFAEVAIPPVKSAIAPVVSIHRPRDGASTAPAKDSTAPVMTTTASGMTFITSVMNIHHPRSGFACPGDEMRVQNPSIFSPNSAPISWNRPNQSTNEQASMHNACMLVRQVESEIPGRSDGTFVDEFGMTWKSAQSRNLAEERSNRRGAAMYCGGADEPEFYDDGAFWDANGDYWESPEQKAAFDFDPQDPFGLRRDEWLAQNGFYPPISNKTPEEMAAEDERIQLEVHEYFGHVAEVVDAGMFGRMTPENLAKYYAPLALEILSSLDGEFLLDLGPIDLGNGNWLEYEDNWNKHEVFFQRVAKALGVALPPSRALAGLRQRSGPQPLPTLLPGLVSLVG